MYIGSVTGGFLSAFLVKFVPYWYLFILFLSAHVLGFVLYGTASHGWALLPAMFFVGLFAGAEVTLVFNYATDISVKYVDLLKERGKTFNCDKTKAVKIRNYLYASHSFGYSIGFIVATGEHRSSYSVKCSLISLVCYPTRKLSPRKLCNKILLEAIPRNIV